MSCFSRLPPVATENHIRDDATEAAALANATARSLFMNPRASDERRVREESESGLR